MAEGELKQMEAERDLLHGMKNAKELELWRSMKATMEQNNGNLNIPSVQAIFLQIKLVVAEQKDPLNRYKLNTSRSTPYHFTSPATEVTVLIDHRITEVKDTQPAQKEFSSETTAQYNVPVPQNKRYQGTDRPYYNNSRMRPAYGSSDWRSNAGLFPQENTF